MSELLVGVRLAAQPLGLVGQQASVCCDCDAPVWLPVAAAERVDAGEAVVACSACAAMGVLRATRWLYLNPECEQLATRLNLPRRIPDRPLLPPSLALLVRESMRGL